MVQAHLDVLMKYLYAAMACFEDGNNNADKKGEGRLGNTILSWHAKVRNQSINQSINQSHHQVITAGGLGSITRVLTDRLSVL